MNENRDCHGRGRLPDVSFAANDRFDHFRQCGTLRKQLINAAAISAYQVGADMMYPHAEVRR
jgi:hypothetical protein